MSNFADLVVFAEPETSASRAGLMTGTGFVTTSVASADGLGKLLDDLWSVALVVIDLRLADDATLRRLQSPGAPPALFLVDPLGAPVETITLAPNVIGYIDLPITSDALREAILTHLPKLPVAGVADFSDRDSARLNALGRDVERIARALSDFAADSGGDTTGSVTAPAVRAIIKRRRERERYFPADLFGDPAWDMMLDLIAAQLEGRNVSVSSLCIAAAVPTTTALRWIRNLCDARIFERNIDPEDARRGIITLSPTTADLMMAYLASVRTAVV